IRISPNFAEAVLPILRTGSWYAPDPPLDRDASLLICTRDDFHRAGGYDEVPPCWTELEDDFRDALSLSGARQATFPAALIRQAAHGEPPPPRPDSLDPPLRQAINRVYRILKRDAARLRGGPLLLSMRQQLFRTVSDVVTAAWSVDRPGDLNL